MSQNENTSSYRTVIDNTGPPQYPNTRGNDRGRGRGDRGAKFTQWRGDKTAYRGGGGDNTRGSRGRGRGAYRGGQEDMGQRPNQSYEQPIADSFQEQPPSTYIKRGDNRRGGFNNPRSNFQNTEQRGRGGYRGKNFNPAYEHRPEPSYHSSAPDPETPEPEAQEAPCDIAKQPSSDSKEAPFQNSFLTRQKRGGTEFGEKSHWDRGEDYQSSRGRGRGSGGNYNNDRPPRERGSNYHSSRGGLGRGTGGDFNNSKPHWQQNYDPTASRGRGRGAPRPSYNDQNTSVTPQNEASQPSQSSSQQEVGETSEEHSQSYTKPHVPRSGYQENYQKPAYVKRQYNPKERDGGYTDKSGFYILPDKSFYDPDGFLFGPDGFDQKGGHYDDFNVYHPPKRSSYPTKRSQTYNNGNYEHKPRPYNNGGHEQKPREYRTYTLEEKQEKYGANYDPNYQHQRNQRPDTQGHHNRDSRPPYQDRRAPRANEEDAFLAPVQQARRGGGAMTQQSTQREAPQEAHAPFIAQRGGGRGGRGGHAPRNPDNQSPQKSQDISLPQSSSGRYQEPSQGHQGGPEHPLAQNQHQPRHEEEDEGDSIFQKAGGAEKKEDLGWLEQQINTDEDPVHHNQREREPMQSNGNAWLQQFDKPEIPDKDTIPSHGPHDEENMQNQTTNGLGPDQNLASNIAENNMILEQQKRQLAILQYYKEQQQFAIKQQNMRINQQAVPDQQAPYMQQPMGEQFQQNNGMPNYEDQQQVQEQEQPYNPNIDYTQQNQQNNGYQNYDEPNQQVDYQNPELEYYQDEPNQYFQHGQNYQDDFQQQPNNNYNYAQPDQFQAEVGNSYYDQQDNFQQEGEMNQNLNLEAAAFVPNQSNFDETVDETPLE